MANLDRLSSDDVERLIRLAATEVDHRLLRRDPAEYRRQAAGVIDTVLNRMASPEFPNTVSGVANQRRQFSKITGPKNLGPYGSIDRVPPSIVPSEFRNAAAQHIQGRMRGLPSSIGGNLHYANPGYITENNRRWVSRLDGPTFGDGPFTHVHGTTRGYDPVVGSFRPGEPPTPRARPETAIAAIDNAMGRSGSGTPVVSAYANPGAALDVASAPQRAPTPRPRPDRPQNYGQDFTSYLASKGATMPQEGEMARMMEQRRAPAMSAPTPRQRPEGLGPQAPVPRARPEGIGSPTPPMLPQGLRNGPNAPTPRQRPSQFVAPVPPERPENLTLLSSISGGDGSSNLGSLLSAPEPRPRPATQQGISGPANVNESLAARLNSDIYDPASDTSQFASIFDVYQTPRQGDGVSSSESARVDFPWPDSLDTGQPPTPTLDEAFGIAQGPNFGLEQWDPSANSYAASSPYTGMDFTTQLPQTGPTTQSAMTPVPPIRPGYLAGGLPQATFASQDVADQQSPLSTLLSLAGKVSPVVGLLDFATSPRAERERTVRDFFTGGAGPSIFSREPVNRRSHGAVSVNDDGNARGFLTPTTHRFRSDRNQKDDRNWRDYYRANKRALGGKSLTQDNIDEGRQRGVTFYKRA